MRALANCSAWRGFHQSWHSRRGPQGHSVRSFSITTKLELKALDRHAEIYVETALPGAALDPSTKPKRFEGQRLLPLKHQHILFDMKLGMMAKEL